MARITGKQKHNSKQALFRTQGGKCAYCVLPFKFKDLTLDHFLPIYLGGTNERGNLRLACFPCNQAKGNKSPWEWMLRAENRGLTA